MGGHPLREQFPSDTWFSIVRGRVAPGMLSFLVSVILPSILLLFLSIELQGWFLGLFWLALSVAVLVYCVEFIDIETAFDDQLAWLGSLQDEDNLEKLLQSRNNFVETITYRVFRSMVPVLFWFLILGPAGALFYALCHHYLGNLEEDNSATELLERILFWMEWVPARVSIFIFALLGEFNRTWEVCVDSFFETEDAVTTSLYHAANAAVNTSRKEFSSVGDFIEQTEIDLNLLQPLLQRSFWGWLGVAAILTILGL